MWWHARSLHNWGTSSLTPDVAGLQQVQQTHRGKGHRDRQLCQESQKTSSINKAWSNPELCTGVYRNQPSSKFLYIHHLSYWYRNMQIQIRLAIVLLSRGCKIYWSNYPSPGWVTDELLCLSANNPALYHWLPHLHWAHDSYFYVSLPS